MTQQTMSQIQTDSEGASSQIKSTIKSNKTKISVYLSEEAENALAELYIARYRNDRKAERSTIVSEAILAFFNQELG